MSFGRAFNLFVATKIYKHSKARAQNGSKNIVNEAPYCISTAFSHLRAVGHKMSCTCMKPLLVKPHQAGSMPGPIRH